VLPGDCLKKFAKHRLIAAKEKVAGSVMMGGPSACGNKGGGYPSREYWKRKLPLSKG